MKQNGIKSKVVTCEIVEQLSFGKTFYKNQFAYEGRMFSDGNSLYSSRKSAIVAARAFCKGLGLECEIKKAKRTEVKA